MIDGRDWRVITMLFHFYFSLFFVSFCFGFLFTLRLKVIRNVQNVLNSYRPMEIRANIMINSIETTSYCWYFFARSPWCPSQDQAPVNHSAHSHSHQTDCTHSHTSFAILLSRVTGRVTFSWKSLATIYAIFFYIAMTVVVFYVGRERIRILGETKRFDEKIYAYIFVIFLVPHFWIPFVGWGK